MRSLTPLVSRELNAPLAWSATLALVLSAVGFVIAGSLHWAVLAGGLAATALVPVAVERDPSATFPGVLLLLVALPPVVRVAGLFQQATPFLSIGGLALLVVVLLDEYTSFETTPRFAAVFVVVTTLAFAAVWTVGIWLSDRFLKTAFVGGQQELMWDLVVAAAMGAIGGTVVLLYLDRIDHADQSPPSDEGGDEGDAEHDGRDGRDEHDEHAEHAERGNEKRGSADSEPSASGDWQRSSTTDSREITDDHGWPRVARLAVRAMQVLLVGIALLGAATGNWGLIINSAVPLAVTFLPALLRREYSYSMHPGLVLWLTLAVFFHAVGALGPYQQFGWYDSVTHALSGSLIAGIGYAVARGVELYTDDVSFSTRFQVLFVVLFVLATGVFWELLEFTTGLIAGATGGEAALAQYGVDDIALDLVYTTAGALLVAIWGTGYFRRPARALAGSVGGLMGRE